MAQHELWSPGPDQLRNALSIAIASWNAATLDAWKPGTTAETDALRRSLEAAGGADPQAMLVLFEGLLARKRTLFADDLRAVGKWDVVRSEQGYSLSADGYLPHNLVQ